MIDLMLRHEDLLAPDDNALNLVTPDESLIEKAFCEMLWRVDEELRRIRRAKES